MAAVLAPRAAAVFPHLPVLPPGSVCARVLMRVADTACLRAVLIARVERLTRGEDPDDTDEAEEEGEQEGDGADETEY
jgi:hypothetical protein